MARIGIIAGSFNPFHSGHMAIVQLASSECDAVRLYVSLSDRVKPGEAPILGADKWIIWQEQLEPILPTNVQVTYGGSPITNVWKGLGAANESGSTDTYVIYSDPVDVASNFTDKQLMKYCGQLFETGHVVLKPVDRQSTVEISGTMMRGFLKSGNKQSFEEMLPDGIDKDAVWDRLYTSAQRGVAKKKKPDVSESSLRSVLKHIVLSS